MAREPASIRYKNPGAMWGSALARKWGAIQTVSLNDGTGQGNNIAVFPTYVQGICAQLDLWRSSPRYKNQTFANAIKVWSGGNHVESYIKFVLDRVPGMTRNTRMDDAFWRSPMGVQFLKAQAWHEAGKPYPAPEADWITAQRRVMGIATPAPEPAPDDEDEDEDESLTPDPALPERKTVGKSKTVWATITGVLSAVGATVGSFMDWKALAVIGVLLIVAAFLFVGRERIKKIIEEGV